MMNDTHAGDTAPVADATTYAELRAKIDRLEHMVDLLGQVVSSHSIDFNQLRGSRPVDRDFTSQPMFEFRVLNPRQWDEETLTWVLDIRGDEANWDHEGPFIAGCGCRWDASTDTPEQAATLATDHASQEHEEFVEQYPQLVGPTMPEEGR